METKEWLDKLVADFEEADMEDSHLRAFYDRWLLENDIEADDLKQKEENDHRDSDKSLC